MIALLEYCWNIPWTSKRHFRGSSIGGQIILIPERFHSQGSQRRACLVDIDEVTGLSPVMPTI